MSVRGPVAAPGNGALMLDVELTSPLPAVRTDGHSRVWVLARLAGQAVGTAAFAATAPELAPADLAGLLWDQLAAPVTAYCTATRLPVPAALPAAGLGTGYEPPATGAGPFISVVVCSRDRAAQLKGCLDLLRELDYPRYEVVVVDNAATDDAVALVVADLAASPGRASAFRYVAEPRPGLSWARNTGVAAAAADVIAFLDDDDEPDPGWLHGIVRGFARGPAVGCVTGVTVTGALQTRAQELFEELGGHSTGRGFVPVTFTRHGPQDPLFPVPPFGAGANMAFRREVLERIGGFDVAMGAGTPARASEDTLAFTRVLLAGYHIAYEPAALMRHNHRPDMDGLRSQLYGYSVGLTAYYVALLRRQPWLAARLAALLPTAVRYLRGAQDQHASVPPELVAEFGKLRLRGFAAGPAAYVRSAWHQRQVAAGRAAARPAGAGTAAGRARAGRP